jgi:putative DNA primase/helicase
MKSQNSRAGSKNPGRHEEITAADIAAALECDNLSCSCHHEGANGWVTHCPAHTDEHPSLSLREGDDGKVLFHCHAGCEQEAVIQEFKDLDLWQSQANTTGTYSSRPPRGKLVIAYGYLDEAERLIFESCRYEPKTFRLRRPDGQGGWVYSIKDIRLVPYQLPGIIKAEVVFIPEGEKDCINLKNQGVTASCNPMGAGKWRKEYNRYFVGKRIVILPDNDEPGRRHAESVARHLHGTATSVKIIELPGLPEKGDVSDWLAAGGTAETLLQIASMAPEWQPSKPSWKPKSFAAGSKGQDKFRL